MLGTVSRSGGQLQTALGALTPADLAGVAPEPTQAADAIVRCGAYRGLREFRARPDASMDLAVAFACAGRAVTSLVQLSLVPEFRRGHSALYDALAAGQIDEEAFAALLTASLPPLAGGDEGRARRDRRRAAGRRAGRAPRGGGRAGPGGVRAVAAAAVRDRRHPVSAPGCRVLPRTRARSS